jgi:lipopolysaccharide transport system ATP-binding protein
MVLKNVSKAFRTYSSEWKRIARLFGAPVRPSVEIWVLRNISFSVREGEAVGIAGQNGAGKSTLLKLITGTMLPTEGSIGLSGRVSAILELGMGFNPELTGRQNVRHAAGLMGLSQPQIESAMERIEEFAEIGDYFDHPVRTYSSGMQMRVAFSVATAYRPDVLIVDEALSVGDAYFQHKSFARIREFRERGTTLLIVSHDRAAIQALCDRVILLERGHMIKDGEPQEVMDFYNAIIAEKQSANTVRVSKSDGGLVQTCSGTGEAYIAAARLLNADGDVVEVVNVGDEVTISVEIAVREDLDQLVVGYLLKDRLGQPVFGTNTYHLNRSLNGVRAGERHVYGFTFSAFLGVGSYSVAVALHGGDTHIGTNYEWRDLALVFSVVNVNREHFVGVNWLPPAVTNSS